MMSRHASARAQQRAVPPLVVDLLLQFGAAESAGAGTHKVFFDKAARRRLHAYAGCLAPLLNEHLDVYAVVASDSTVVTVAHRLDRIKRH